MFWRRQEAFEGSIGELCAGVQQSFYLGVHLKLMINAFETADFYGFNADGYVDFDLSLLRSAMKVKRMRDEREMMSPRVWSEVWV